MDGILKGVLVGDSGHHFRDSRAMRMFMEK